MCYRVIVMYDPSLGLQANSNVNEKVVYLVLSYLLEAGCRCSRCKKEKKGFNVDPPLLVVLCFR